MTKRLSLVLGTIAIAIACGFILTGKLIQKSYYNTLASINSQERAKVSLIRYDRGLFSSRAVIEIELPKHKLSLQQNIKHGPILVANTPHGTRIKAVAAQISTTLDPEVEKLAPVQITSLVNFSNQVQTWILAPGQNQTTNNQLNLSWETISGTILHNLDFAEYQAEFKLPKISLNKPEWQLNLQNIALNLSPGKSKLQGGNLSFGKNGSVLISMDELSSELSLSKVEDKVAVDFLATIASSQIVQQKFAQDTFKIKVNNISSLALANLPPLASLNPVSAMNLAQQLTAESTDLAVEFPKYFTEALLSYFSFEIYKTSPLAIADQRPDTEVLKDITNSISKLVQGAVKQQLFVDTGVSYALNTATKS